MKKVISILAILLLCWAGAALAEPFSVEVNGTELTVSYVEPATNEDGSPLVDLDHTSIYVTHGVWNSTSQTVDLVTTHLMNVPASSPSGGGTITQKVTVPKAEGVITVTASDEVPNESKPVSEDFDSLPPGNVK